MFEIRSAHGNKSRHVNSSMIFMNDKTGGYGRPILAKRLWYLKGQHWQVLRSMLGFEPSHITYHYTTTCRGLHYLLTYKGEHPSSGKQLQCWDLKLIRTLHHGPLTIAPPTKICHIYLILKFCKCSVLYGTRQRVDFYTATLMDRFLSL